MGWYGAGAPRDGLRQPPLEVFEFVGRHARLQQPANFPTRGLLAEPFDKAEFFESLQTRL